MRKIFVVMLISITTALHGCVLLMMLGGPLNMVAAGGGYYASYQQGVKLFKIKAPAPDWRIHESSLIDPIGNNTYLDFLYSSSETYRSELPTINFIIIFNVINKKQYYMDNIKFLEGNEDALKTSLGLGKNDSENSWEYFGERYIADVKCISDKGYDNRGIGQGRRFFVSVYCPGFFRNTLGQLVYTVLIDDANHLYGVSLEERYKTVEPLIQKSIDSFKFVAKFSQKIPSNYSVDEQISRIKAGHREGEPSKFKL